MIIYYILLGVYLAAINFYAVVIAHYQKKTLEEDCCDSSSIKDGKLFLTGLLGGALGIYLFMLIRKYRLKSLFLMITMPILAALNGWLVYLAIAHNFGIAIAAPAAYAFLLF